MPYFASDTCCLFIYSENRQRIMRSSFYLEDIWGKRKRGVRKFQNKSKNMLTFIETFGKMIFAPLSGAQNLKKPQKLFQIKLKKVLDKIWQLMIIYTSCC